MDWNSWLMTYDYRLLSTDPLSDVDKLKEMILVLINVIFVRQKIQISTKVLI